MTKQQTQQALINIEYKVAKPFVDAGALALGSSAFAMVLQAPVFNWALVGGGFSLVFYWGRENLTATRSKHKKSKRRDDYLIVNSTNGRRQINRFEQVSPTYITRRSLWTDLTSLLKGKPEPRVINQSPVSPRRPQTLDQFVFVSYDDAGNRVQLNSSNVRNFLWEAWKDQDKGKGLGKRKWDYRNRKTWPSWYPGPEWYEAMIRLLLSTQNGLGRQLVIIIQDEPRRMKLRYPPRGENGTYEHILWWYTENMKK